MLSTQSGFRLLTPLLTISSLILPRKASTLCRTLCAPFVRTGLFGLAEQQQFQFVWLYPQSDFVGLDGKVILTSESGGDFADTVIVSWNGTQYVKTSFAPGPRHKRGCLFR